MEGAVLGRGFPGGKRELRLFVVAWLGLTDVGWIDISCFEGLAMALGCLCLLCSAGRQDGEVMVMDGMDLWRVERSTRELRTLVEL